MRREGFGRRALFTRSARPVGPWSSDHLTGVVVGNAVGLMLIVIGWWLVSGSPDGQYQIGRLEVAVIGLAIAAAVNVWWLSRARRALASARRAVYVAVGQRRASAERPAPVGAGIPVPPAVTGTAALVSGRGMTWYHLPGCSLAMGKQVRPADLAAWELDGRTPCDLCHP